MFHQLLIASLFLSGFVLAMPEMATAQCQNCDKGCSGNCANSSCQNCCRPCRTKIVYKRNSFGGGIMGAAAPQGYAVASVPAMMVQTPAFAAAPAFVSTASVTQASLSTADIERVADAVNKRQTTAAATTAAAGTTSRECPDACGSILQLRKDVDELIVVTNKLTIAVEKLADKIKN